MRSDSTLGFRAKALLLFTALALGCFLLPWSSPAFAGHDHKHDCDGDLDRIRKDLDAGDIRFEDSNWTRELERTFDDLNRKLAYYESIRKYFHDHKQYEQTIDGLKEAYLHKMEQILEHRLPAEEEEPASDPEPESEPEPDPTPDPESNSGGGSGSSPSQAVKKIVLTLDDGTEHVWHFIPATGDERPSLIKQDEETKEGD